MDEAGNRQIQVFRDAAQAMKNERYAQQTSVEGQRDFLYALQDVARELAYHLNTHKILDQPAMASYAATSATEMPPFEASAELILTVELEASIQKLWQQEKLG